ncbi:hypothetical protein HNR08_000067 [Cellulomonas hominis]|uniref:Uncharacterized protein n=1 Tax=Cellulomonas hominis TaxID=156981 RepID=A0A7W8SA36_9CELL|nr:hypothetical protein [Cellulomonas hominis]
MPAPLAETVSADAGYLAGSVAGHRLDEDEAADASTWWPGGRGSGQAPPTRTSPVS